jgi:hypothetical protein
MRKFLLSIVVATTVTLGGCGTTQVQQIETFIGQVQADAALVCKFVPEVSTIIALVNSGIGQVVGAVVQAVCNAIPPPASAQFRALHFRGLGPAVTVSTVGNIPISGWRTQ